MNEKKVRNWNLSRLELNLFTRIEELDYHKYFCYRDWIFFFSNHKIQSRGDQIFIIFTTNFLGSESKQGK